MRSPKHNLILFGIPASFVLARALPTAGEVAYGLRHGWLNALDASAVVQARSERGAAVGEDELVLANAANDDPRRITRAISAVSRMPGAERSDRLWMYLALDWVHTHRGEFEDVFRATTLLWDDFEHAAELEGLVKFLPPPPGEPVGIPAMEARLRRVIASFAREFRGRPVH